MSVLGFHGAGVTYGDGRTRTVALAPTDLTVEAGQTVGVVGRSGAGKTTLAELALGLRRPSYGRITVDGHPWSDPHTTPSRRHRNRVQGVPQDALATLPPRWTVERTLRITAHRLTGDRDVVAPVVRALTVAQCEPELSGRRPHELSGGQAQRVAIARALVASPSVIVADEPTSALDATTAGSVVDTLFDLARTSGVAIVVVTHDHTLAARCDRLLEVVEGHVCEIVR